MVVVVFVVAFFSSFCDGYHIETHIRSHVQIVLLAHSFYFTQSRRRKNNTRKKEIISHLKYDGYILPFISGINNLDLA